MPENQLFFLRRFIFFYLLEMGCPLKQAYAFVIELLPNKINQHQYISKLKIANSDFSGIEPMVAIPAIYLVYFCNVYSKNKCDPLNSLFLTFNHQYKRDLLLKFYLNHPNISNEGIRFYKFFNVLLVNFPNVLLISGLLPTDFFENFQKVILKINDLELLANINISDNKNIPFSQSTFDTLGQLYLTLVILSMAGFTDGIVDGVLEHIMEDVKNLPEYNEALESDTKNYQKFRDSLPYQYWRDLLDKTVRGGTQQERKQNWDKTNKKKTFREKLIELIKGKGPTIGYSNSNEFNCTDFLRNTIIKISFLINLYDFTQTVFLLIPPSVKKYFYKIFFEEIVNEIKFTIEKIDQWIEKNDWVEINLIFFKKTSYIISNINQIRREINYLKYVYRSIKSMIVDQSEQAISIDDLYNSSLISLHLLFELILMLHRVKNIILFNPSNPSIKKKFKIKDLKLINYHLLTLNFVALDELDLINKTDFSKIDFVTSKKFLLGLPECKIKIDLIQSIEGVEELDRNFMQKVRKSEIKKVFHEIILPNKNLIQFYH